jgi:hypothetical protein
LENWGWGSIVSKLRQIGIHWRGGNKIQKLSFWQAFGRVGPGGAIDYFKLKFHKYVFSALSGAFLPSKKILSGGTGSLIKYASSAGVTFLPFSLSPGFFNRIPSVPLDAQPRAGNAYLEAPPPGKIPLPYNCR